jgi:hypothetical protein
MGGLDAAGQARGPDARRLRLPQDRSPDGGDFDVGRPYYFVIEGAAPGAGLEWKMLGRDWQPVAKTSSLSADALGPAAGAQPR